jgi:hypothetical protein
MINKFKFVVRFYYYHAAGGTRTHTDKSPKDFKSFAYTSSATAAKKIYLRPGWESNPYTGFCRPLPNHSATRPKKGLQLLK